MAEQTEVEGLARLTSTLAAFARSLPDVAPPAASRIIGQQARMNAPKRTGRLASSWASDDSAGALGLSFGNGNVRYASPIHWGVGPRVGLRGPHNIRPSMYLLRAVESTQGQWVQQYENTITTELGKVKGA